MDNSSLADSAAGTGRGRYGCSDGLTGDGSWFFALIILFVLMFGMNGWNRGTSDMATQAGQYATQSDIQRGFDTNTIVNKLDGISNGICDATFALNNTMQQGFATSNLNTVNGFNTVNTGICNLGHEIQSCCCETNRNIDSVRYENAKNTCDIINASNNNTQRIIDTITNNTIQELRDQLQSANLQLGNLNQTSTIVNAVRPVPIPAYITCSPYQAAGFYNNGCGCSTL